MRDAPQAQAAEGVYLPPDGSKKSGSPTKKDGVHWYPPGPIARAYMNDDSLVCGIRGPFRSAKSTTSVMKLIKNAQLQPASPDGWKRRRTAIIRNTYPELRTTTMPTWFQWIPQHKGKWRDTGPPMHHLIDSVSKLDWEIWFIALDRPDDVKKLLSMELSDAWVNEAREVPKAIIDALTGRVGQYPARWQGGCLNPQLLLDTNPPDEDHWWYTLAERDVSSEKKRALIASIDEAEAKLRASGVLKPNQKLFNFHSQPSGRGPDAENIRNIRPGYYDILMAGKDQQFIKVYVDGEYGYVMDGKPVQPNYKEHFHVKDIEPVKGVGLRLGHDWGLTPACSISQRLGNGRWLVIDEYVSERMGISSYGEGLAKYLAEKYPGFKIVSSRGDPSGDAVTPEESTCFKIMTTAGIPTEPAPTNDPVRRREGLSYLLRTVVDGEPAITISRKCHTLRKGLGGGFHYRRLQVVGEERYRDVPEKNMYSHVCEGLEYDCVSGGEDRNVTVLPEHRSGKGRKEYADSEYDVLGDR